MFKKLITKIKSKLGYCIVPPIPNIVILSSYFDYKEILNSFRVDFKTIYSVELGVVTIEIRPIKQWMFIKRSNLKKCKFHIDICKPIGVYVEYLTIEEGGQ